MEWRVFPSNRADREIAQRFHTLEMRLLLTTAYFTSYSHHRVAVSSFITNHYSPVRRLMSTTTRKSPPLYRTESLMKMSSSTEDLVDVDCNLLHKDLISMMMENSSLDVANNNNIQDPFKILHHPSTRSIIKAMISPSSTIKESEQSVHLLQNCTSSDRNNIRIKTTVGVHPYHSEEEALTPENLDILRSMLKNDANNNNNDIIGSIGETGLDYSEGFPDKQFQIPWFQSQLDLAFEFGLPIFLHERLAFQDTLKCIDEAVERHHQGQQQQQQATIPKIIVHCYTGTFSECMEYMKRGYYISVSGYILKPDSEEVRKCLREGIIPLDRLMIETDAPYMGFAGNKDSFFEAEGDSFTSLPSKKRKRLLKSQYPNVPSSLHRVLEETCKQINLGRKERHEEMISLDQLAASTTRVATDFFQL